MARLDQHVVGGLEALIEELHPIDQFVGSLHDFFLVLGLAHLSPSHLQHAEHHIERLAARDDYALVVGALPDVGCIGEGELQSTLAVDVHHHKVELGLPLAGIFVVAFGGEFLDVVAYRRDVALQGLGALFVGLGVVVVLKGLE